MCHSFYISFCCKIWQINFNVYISSKTSESLRKVFIHFYMRYFLLIQLLKQLSYPFQWTYNLPPFLLSTFSILIFFLTNFLQFFLIKTFSNFFIIQALNNINPRNFIFNFTSNKNFFGPIWGIFFSKNVFVFSDFNMVTNFKFTIFFIKIFIVFSIRIITSIGFILIVL